MYKKILIAVALSTVSALAVAADSHGAATQSKAAKNSAVPTFEKLDKNHDGKISVDEAKTVPGLSAVFGRADEDGNGTLSKSEYDSITRGMKHS